MDISDDIKKLPIRNKLKNKGKMFLVPPPIGKCSHFRGPFVVDEHAGTCLCEECGESVSPMFVLKRLMQKESQWNRTRSDYLDEMKRLKKRSRTKCIHCGEMTSISRN